MPVRHALIVFAAAMLAASPAAARASPAADFYCEVWHAYYPEVLACPVPWQVAPIPRPLSFGQPNGMQPSAVAAHARRSRNAARPPVFRAIGDGLDQWCSRARLPSSVAICSDTGLRALALERQHALDRARSRLGREQQKVLLANEGTWVKAYSALCGLSRTAPPGLPLSAAVENCMAEAGRARLAYLQTYRVAALGVIAAPPSNAAPDEADATPAAPAVPAAAPKPQEPPRRLQPGWVEGSTARPDADAKPTTGPAPESPSSTASGAPVNQAKRGASEAWPDARILVTLLLAGIGAAAGAAGLWQRRRRAARRREIDSACRYFDRLSTARSFPAVEVPIALEPGEFGLLSGPATLFERGYWRLNQVAPGSLSLTNRRLVFTGNERDAHFRLAELSDVDFDGCLRLASRQKSAPIILGLDHGKLAAVLIRSFANGIFRDRQLPDGLTISARPSACGDDVDLQLHLPRLIHLAQAIASAEVASARANPIIDAASAMPRLAAAEL